MKIEPTADVLVIGAGLAGARAAEMLGAAGFAVALLEARERAGGRAYQRAFAGSNETLDFGGSWITPWHWRMRAACQRHAIALRPRHPLTSTRWWREGALHFDAPARPHDLASHERAIERIRMDAMALKSGGARFDLSFSHYLGSLTQEPLRMPASTRDLCMAWWSVSGNGDPDRVAASEFLSSCAYGDGRPDGMMEVWADTLSGGAGQLAERMLAASGASVHYNAELRRIAHGTGKVQATLADGRSFTARTAILATGINPLRAIEFDPPLDQAKRSAIASGHLGRAVKVWVKAKGLALGARATGNAGGLNWMFVERATPDGCQLVVGFGLARPDFDPGDANAVGAVFARFFPEGRFLASDWHDWVGDPHSLGSWVAPPLGQEAGLSSANWAWFGSLAFASSDFSPESAGWFEAALVSGELAAEQAMDNLRA
jgi:monoamine oxidase